MLSPCLFILILCSCLSIKMFIFTGWLVVDFNFDICQLAGKRSLTQTR